MELLRSQKPLEVEEVDKHAMMQTPVESQAVLTHHVEVNGPRLCYQRRKSNSNKKL